MRAHYTSADPLLALRPHRSKPQWHNLILLALALTIGRAFVLWQLAVAVLLPIRLGSCYQRLKRLLRWRGVDLGGPQAGLAALGAGALRRAGPAAAPVDRL